MTTRRIALFAALALLLGSCTSSREEAGGSDSEKIPRGGTLRVELYEIAEAPWTHLDLDPQRGWWFGNFELSRCCLLRTLLSYNGKTTKEGGTKLRPDLAASQPDVSADGSTWTFRLKKGLTYAPPFETTEITAQDIIRALERAARYGQETGYASFYRSIEGFSEVLEGQADSISGLEARDNHTLVVHLTDPTGDLGYLFSLPAAAPIPPDPVDGSKLGAATGHNKNYGSFLVSSGPYMIRGAEELDYTIPAKERDPVAGYEPRRSLELVRNPSWDPTTDAIRPAYADVIEVRLGTSLKKATYRVRDGESDVLMNMFLPPQMPLSLLDEYRSDPSLEERLSFYPRDFIRYMSMNMALPPLDDIHVRKAINYAVNKARLIEISGGRGVAEPATHLILDSLQDNLLLDYDPYETPVAAGDPEAAAAEMALSRYDKDGDGSCDHAACRGVSAVTFVPREGVGLSGRVATLQARSIVQDLKSIGIAVDLRELPPPEVFEMLGDPTKKVGLGIAVSWGKDYPSGSTFGGLFASGTPDNYALVGAAPDDLKKWGYPIATVPSVDDKVKECGGLVGDRQSPCWAELDQILMEQVVPWVPLLVEQLAQPVSERVVNYSFDQANTMPALDRIAVAP
jgi:peptide/nickel transport system substrate-binding protein